MKTKIKRLPYVKRNIYSPQKYKQLKPLLDEIDADRDVLNIFFEWMEKDTELNEQLSNVLAEQTKILTELRKCTKEFFESYSKLIALCLPDARSN